MPNDISPADGVINIQQEKKYKCTECGKIFSDDDMVLYKLNTQEGICRSCNRKQYEK